MSNEPLLCVPPTHVVKCYTSTCSFLYALYTQVILTSQYVFHWTHCKPLFLMRYLNTKHGSKYRYHGIRLRETFYAVQCRYTPQETKRYESFISAVSFIYVLKQEVILSHFTIDDAIWSSDLAVAGYGNFPTMKWITKAPFSQCHLEFMSHNSKLTVIPPIPSTLLLSWLQLCNWGHDLGWLFA